MAVQYYYRPERMGTADERYLIPLVKASGMFGVPERTLRRWAANAKIGAYQGKGNRWFVFDPARYSLYR